MIPRILNKVFHDVWAITPEQHNALVETLNNHLHALDDINGAIQQPMAQLQRVNESTVIIPIEGTIGKRLSMMERAFGFVDVDDISAAIDEVSIDETVETVIFDINSNGGGICGVPELADKIFALGQTKQTIAVTEEAMFSAAYWLGSQANLVYATESASTGSVGVYCMVYDYSKAYEAEGLKVDPISSGKFKLMGSDFKPLTEEERAIMQKDVENWHEKFKAAILRKRNIDAEYLEGQTFNGNESAAANLIDGTISEFFDVLTLTEKR